LIKEHYEMLFS